MIKLRCESIISAALKAEQLLLLQQPLGEFPITWILRRSLFQFSLSVAFQMTKKSMFSAPNVVAGSIQIVQWYQSGPSRESGNAKNAKIEELFDQVIV